MLIGTDLYYFVMLAHGHYQSCKFLHWQPWVCKFLRLFTMRLCYCSQAETSVSTTQLSLPLSGEVTFLGTLLGGVTRLWLPILLRWGFPQIFVHPTSYDLLCAVLAASGNDRTRSCNLPSEDHDYSLLECYGSVRRELIHGTRRKNLSRQLDPDSQINGKHAERARYSLYIHIYMYARQHVKLSPWMKLCLTSWFWQASQDAKLAHWSRFV